MNNTDVLFIIPQYILIGGEESSTYLARYPHLGIAYLASCLKVARYTYKIIDMNLGYKNEDILNFINDLKPNLICITLYSANYKSVYSFIEFLKLNSQVLIVVGGPHVSIVRQEVLEESLSDYAILGEGEIPLPRLVFEINQPIPEFEKIEGLIWKDGGKIISNAPCAYISDLDSLPYPDFDSFEIEKYLCSSDMRLPIITSRGCPFHCNYCCTWLSMGHGFRKRTPQNIMAEIEFWYQKGWRVFDFNDDIFTLDRKRAIDVCNLLIQKKLDISINLYVGIRVNSIDEELLNKLKQANCKFISYGCEAGNDKILRDIKKNITIKEVFEANALTNKVGINHKFNFIVGHLTETYQDAMDSINVAKKLKSSFVSFNNLIPYPNTPLYEEIMNCPEAHFITDYHEYLNDLTHKRLMPVFETTYFTEKERKKILKISSDLERKTLYCFRFGIIFGNARYIVEKNAFLAKHLKRVVSFVLSTDFGYYLYKSLIKPPW